MIQKLKFLAVPGVNDVFVMYYVFHDYLWQTRPEGLGAFPRKNVLNVH